MINMFELAEKAYFFELERKADLNKGLAFPFTVVFGGIALLGYSLIKVEVLQTFPMAMFFGVLVFFLFTASFAAFIFHVWHFSLHPDYKAIWLMDGTLYYLEQLKKYHRDCGDESNAETQFVSDMTKELAVCTSKNAQLNDKRGLHLHKCKAYALFFTLFALIFSVICALSELAR